MNRRVLKGLIASHISVPTPAEHIDAIKLTKVPACNPTMDIPDGQEAIAYHIGPEASDIRTLATLVGATDVSDLTLKAPHALAGVCRVCVDRVIKGVA